MAREAGSSPEYLLSLLPVLRPRHHGSSSRSSPLAGTRAGRYSEVQWVERTNQGLRVSRWKMEKLPRVAQGCVTCLMWPGLGKVTPPLQASVFSSGKWKEQSYHQGWQTRT